MAKVLRPFYEDVQAHYDLSNDFYQLFLDESMTYSCAFFPRERMTLEEAQLAKIELSLSKCDLHPGQRLLDVGCGWGATALVAADRFGVRVVGLTLSRQQHVLASHRAAGRRDVEFRLQGWEDFDEPVDRIVSIGALEHFRIERYGAFFARARKILPANGRMMVHSIVHGTRETLQDGQPEVTEELIAYMKFMAKHIFPGGQVPPREAITRTAEQQGLRTVHVESLRPHYAMTLDAWAARLQASHEQAIELVGADIFDKYMRYLTESAYFFRTGHCDVVQFTMVPAAS